MDKFEEQVCHNFDQFLPLNAVTYPDLNSSCPQLVLNIHTTIIGMTLKIRQI